MKRILTAVCACALLLCGCGSERPAGLEKTQEIRVLAPSGELVRVLTDDAELDAFSDALEAESWDPASIPEGSAFRGEFVLLQTETLKFGQSPEDLQMEELARLRLYSPPYVSLTVLNLELCSKLSDSSYEHLSSYLE